jgi:GNAT superfamily N-acetyltransferase
MRILLAQTDTDLERVSPVLRQLRPQYTHEALMGRIRAQRADGYHLAYVESDDARVLCVAGFVISSKLAFGRHLYVDDLVSDAAARSTGAGKAIMDWLKAHARAQGCVQLHLDSGVQRFDAHRFYLREGFRIASHHFAIDLAPSE